MNNLKEIAEKAARECDLKFQYDHNYFEFSSEILELITRFGNQGLYAFNLAYAKILEKRLEEKIISLERELQNSIMQAPKKHYNSRELEFLRGIAGKAFNNVIEDYHIIQATIRAYKNFLSDYKKGKPLKVYINREKGKAIIIQKPFN